MTEVFLSIHEIKFEEFRWIDTRFSLQDSEAGKRKYEEGHVAGAVYWDLEKDLSDMSKNEGRHPMPEKEAITELIRKSGLTLEDSIIIYDDGGNPFAARAWWLLQYAGFTKSFICIEGFEAIRETGIPVDTNTPEPKVTSVSPEWNERIFATREFVEKTVAGEDESVLVDARSAERYRGETEPIDPIAGRIPGARNFDWERLKKNNLYNFDDSVKQELGQVVQPTESLAVYCGSGVTAAPLYAMLAHFGYDRLRLYVGSYSDWISIEGAPVEKN